MKKFVFIAGLHRSGTTVLSKILGEQQNFSGFKDTGVLMDEGQFLQTVYKPAFEFGGVGRFAFHQQSHLTESSELISSENKQKMFAEWAKYWDLSKEYLIEKSPPNILHTRFLQEMFENTYFISILRHPIAVSIASQKWCKMRLPALIKHWVHCHKIYEEDKPYLKNLLEIRYEDLIEKTDETIAKISTFLGAEISLNNYKLSDNNSDYFKLWNEWRKTDFVRKMAYNYLKLKYSGFISKYGYSFSV